MPVMRVDRLTLFFFVCASKRGSAPLLLQLFLCVFVFAVRSALLTGTPFPPLPLSCHDAHIDTSSSTSSTSSETEPPTEPPTVPPITETPAPSLAGPEEGSSGARKRFVIGADGGGVAMVAAGAAAVLAAVHTY